MKVNITGLLRSCQALIHSDEDRGAYAYMLGELINHIEDVRNGKHTLEELADFYCMKPKETVG